MQVHIYYHKAGIPYDVLAVKKCINGFCGNLSLPGKQCSKLFNNIEYIEIEMEVTEISEPVLSISSKQVVGQISYFV